MPELFTIISLMIGLFGGSISTIVVIRTVCDRKVARHLEGSKEKIEEMEKSECQEDTLKEADGYREGIKRCRDSFRSLTLIPSIIFLLWIFSASFYVSLSVECKMLFDHSQEGSQKSETKDADETKEPQDARQTSSRMIVDAVNLFLKSILFRRRTILIITIIFALCVLYAWRNLRGADKQYRELTKLHTTAMREKAPTYKKA